MRLLAVTVLVACSSSTPPPLVANRAAPPSKPRCDVPALSRMLAKRWQLELEAMDLDCTPGRFPAPGFFIEARQGVRHVIGIVDAGTLDEIAPFVDEPERAVSTIQRASADLDGDGVDEIVETWRDSAHAQTGVGNRLVVRRVLAGSIDLIDGPHAGVFHPDLGSCHAEARIEARELVIHVKRIVGIPPSDCLAPGLHRFVLDGDAMVHVRPRR